MANGIPINEFDREKEFYMAKNKELFYEDYISRIAKLETKIRKTYFFNSVFKKTAKYERELEKEIFNFSPDELIDTLKGFGSTSVDYLNNVLSLIRGYTDFCIASDSHLVNDGQNPFLHIGYDALIQCINRDVLSNGILTRVTLRSLTRGRRIQNMTDLAAIFLIYEGVTGYRYTDILNLSFDDIDYKRKVCKTISGKALPLTDDCLSVIREAQKEEAYILPSEKKMPYLDNLIVRSFRKDQLDRTGKNIVLLVDILRRRVVKCLAQYDINDVTFSNINVSGQIDFIKRKANESGVKVSDFIMTKECKEMIVNQYGKENWMAKNFYAKYKYFLEDDV